MAHRWDSPADALNRLFRRCLECPVGRPSCPVCAKDETCSLVPQDCNNCAYMTCLKVRDLPGQQLPQDSTPVGPIVGGVVGGVVAIMIVTYLVWRFCIQRRKRQNLWEPPEKTPMDRPGTTLTRTHSIASTVMTRASNVIQIAYIPGVTVRSAPDSPEIPPPMPSIPSTYATSNNTTPNLEQHFFMPKDLRDSVWSDTSSVMTDPRISIAPSLARTTVYQENAIPPVPAQYAYRAQANAVSVRSGNSTPSLGQNGNATPPMPQVPKTININGSSIVARNVVAKPIELKKTSSGASKNTLDTIPKKSASRRVTPVPTISDEKEVVFTSPSSAAFSESHQSTLIGAEGTSTSVSSEIPSTERPQGGASVSSSRPTTAYAEAMIHEAMMRAAQDASHAGPVSKPSRPDLKTHDSGPFSDANEIK